MGLQMKPVRVMVLPEHLIETLQHHHLEVFIQPNSWTGFNWTALTFIKHMILNVSIILNAL
jgi:hypothetical protein